MARTREIVIKSTHRGLRYEDGRLTDVLEAGRYEMPDTERRRRNTPVVEVVLVDMRERELLLKGQEILTSDKVAVRVSIITQYRVVDPAAALEKVESYADRLYSDVQLAARRSLARDREVLQAAPDEAQHLVPAVLRLDELGVLREMALEALLVGRQPEEPVLLGQPLERDLGVVRADRPARRLDDVGRIPEALVRAVPALVCAEVDVAIGIRSSDHLLRCRDMVRVRRPDEPVGGDPERALGGVKERDLLGEVLGHRPALVDGRYNVGFRDVAAVAPLALRHRLILGFEAEADGWDAEKVVAAILEATPQKDLLHAE